MKPEMQVAQLPPMGTNSVPFGVWVQAIRPKTLTAGLMPVLVGSALAFHHGGFRLLPALAALVGALLIQIGTNLTNDYYDFKKGADTEERVGPKRVTQAGLIKPGTVLAAALLSFGLAVLSGLYLVYVGGWPIVAIGVASVLSGYAYTGGPFPLGYHGLGDVFVFVFFGLVAVAGTYFVQTLHLDPAVWLAALPVGGIGTALLVVNNLRDAETDAKAGKRTLAVRFGVGFARAEYVTLLLLSYATPFVLFATGRASIWVLLPLLSLPLALKPLRLVLKERGPVLNAGLHGTARLQLVFGVLFALGLAL